MNNQKGFTLIELLVYIGVSTVFLLALSGFVFSIFATYRQANVKSHQQQSFVNLNARLQHLFDDVYGIDPVSNFDVDLSSVNGAAIVFHSRNASENPMTITVANNELIIQKGAQNAIALHSSDIRLVSCVFTNQSTSESAHIGISIIFSTPVGFGLPDAEMKADLTFELKDYAP